MQALNNPHCIWLQIKATVVTAQNSLLICFPKDLTCSGFEKNHSQCLAFCCCPCSQKHTSLTRLNCLSCVQMPAGCPKRCFPTCSVSGGFIGSQFISPPPQQVRRRLVFSLLRTKSAVKALVQFVEESNSTPASAPKEHEPSSPTFGEVAFRLSVALGLSVPVEPSHSLWNICIFPKLTTTLQLTREDTYW